MLSIDETLKDIYRNDIIPETSELAHKKLTLFFPSLNLSITNDKIVGESFELIESICSDQELVFGSCIASQLKITVADLQEDLSGYEFILTQTVNDTYPLPLGKFKVYSCEKQNDLWFREIIAYDALKSADIDVSDWYKSLYPTGNETYTLKQFRQSLLSHLGLKEEETYTLPNDNMLVTKTIDPTKLSGRDVLRRCVELQGAFGHIGRTGKFKHIILEPAYGLYPSPNLFPKNDLYPVSTNNTGYVYDYSKSGLYPSEILYPSVNLYPISVLDPSPFGSSKEIITKAMQKQPVRYEEYTVKGIDKLIIRTDEDDVGIIVGTGSNAYTIQGNFLLYGKSASELEKIAWNIFGNIAKRPYRPFEVEVIGLPYVETGDSVKLEPYDNINGYIFHRTLTGIQALRDKFEAKGSEQREQNFGLNEEIIQLKGRAARIKKDVEGVRVEVENLEESTNTRFEQTAAAISAEVSRAISAEEELNSKITLTAEALTSEINRATQAEGELSSRIEQNATAITSEVSRALGAEAVLDSKITQTADAIIAEVNRATQAEGQLSGQIAVLAGQVVLKVDGNGNVAAVELDADPTQGSQIKLKADNISLEGYVSINGYTKINNDGSLEVVNAKINGVFTTTGDYGTTVITNGAVDADAIFAGGVVTDTLLALDRISVGTNIVLDAYEGNIQCNFINGWAPITAGNIGNQSVSSANYAVNAGRASEANTAYNADRLGYTVYISENGNFRPFNDAMVSSGTSLGRWSSVWAVNDTIQTSDERKKKNIKPLSEDERFLKFAKKIVPYMYQMIDGTSGRYHLGFIGQRIAEAMIECGISDTEFAGLVKEPIYARKLKDSNGNEINEYDTSSEIIGYEYDLRYAEFIPLVFLWLKNLDSD